MNPVFVICIVTLFLSVVMYGISMLWFFLISKRITTYIPQGIAIFGSIFAVIILFILAQSTDMGDTLAIIFFSTFVVLPIFLAALISGVVTMITKWILVQRVQPSMDSNRSD